MTDAEINEKWFKALGYYKDEGSAMWRHPNGNAFRIDGYLPNPCQHYPDFKKWVLEVIHGEGHYFIFETREVHLHYYPDPLVTVEIKDNEILTAAVVAATRYWEEKK